MPKLSTHHLSIGYSKKTTKKLIQSDLNLFLNSGELACLIGPNGCGKSTLLRSLSGLQAALQGEIKIGNKEINTLSQHERSLLISMVLTERIEIEHCTVFDLVAMGRHPHRNWWKNSLSTKEKEMVDKSIAMVHLEQKREHLINELSDGERQRAMIAKALVQDTPIVLLDEPTAHLDLPNRVEIMLLLHQLANQTKKAILLSTHELDLALQASDRIWLMNLEQGIECGVPEDLIFNGSFDRTFKSENYSFSKKNGSFIMKHQSKNQSVALIGEQERLFWTERALTRSGYKIDTSSDIKVLIRKDDWILNKTKINTVAELIECLSRTNAAENNLLVKNSNKN